MFRGWNSYFCNVNDKLASIFLDFDLRESAADRSKPWLLWVWVYFEQPRADGLSSREEFETLSALEEKLVTDIGTRCEATMCGRITTDGRREFYFYAADARNFEQAVANSLSSFATYEFECDTQEDREWTQYLNVLYPGEEDMERIKNRAVLEVLQKQGDTLETPRELLHWAYFNTSGDRDQFKANAKNSGFRIDSESSNNKEYPLGICIARQQEMNSDALDEAVLVLFRAAKRANGVYDGWESPVIGSQPVPDKKPWWKC